MIPDEVFKLFHLRCLYLRDTNVRTIPKSIGKLQNLETLDLYQTFVTELPVQILKLRRLRHLIVGRVTDLDLYQPFVTELPVPIRRLRRLGHLIVGRVTDLGLYDSIESFSAPYKIGSLNSLQTLRFIEAGERDGVKIVTEIGKLTQLRSLGITKLRKEDGKDLCFSLERLTNLRKLRLVSIEEDEIIDLQHTLRAIPYLLRKLILTGRLEKVPQWIPSLQGLTTCYLQRSRLKNEPLLYLEDSPNLIHLALFDAYEGEQLHFKAGKFQRLKSLEFTRLKELRWVTVEKSSMPCLEELWIADSKLMEELPSGIEYLSKLEHLYLFNMAEKLITSLQNQENRSTQAVIHVGDIEKLEDAGILG